MQIELSDDEALVLFELLHGYGSKDDGRTLIVRHAADRNVLWGLACLLERQLVPPFCPDYDDQLAAARQRIEERGGSW